MEICRVVGGEIWGRFYKSRLLLGLLRLQVKVKEKNREFFKYLQKLRMARASDDNLPWQRLVSD